MAKKRVLGVVGMGHVGAHVAYALAIQGIADELVLVDQNEQKLASEVQDLRDAAAYRGGKCISETMTKGDLYTKLVWECHDGHRFEASPYTVLKAGHWCPVCCQPEPWDFDRLAKFMPFYAQVWYDTHAVEENTCLLYTSDAADE